MKMVNITTLRSQLSRLLEEVRRGQEIEVLDRSVPIARVVPVRPATGVAGHRMPPWLLRQRRAGVVRIGSLKPVGEVLRGFPPGKRPLDSRAVEALLEERREGR
jgi:prevent-host-death family protein